MQRDWWKESVVYQIYPRSFYDTDGDGIGDLRGILAKLDHISDLGVDVVWLSPVYKSPNDDNGYDISGYRDIMAEFGTLADWDELIGAMHDRGIRLVMDLVVNHTSDEHPWFVASRESTDNPFRDYYIWRPSRDGREPNNWSSVFGGSAWHRDAGTGEYYLHLFSKKQPDLNWENPAVRREVFALMRWWLDRGVDGFRMDVINLISKVPGLPDARVVAPGTFQWGGEHFVNGPRLAEFLAEMDQEVLSGRELFTVGETPLVSPQDALAIAGEGRPLRTVFQFEHMDLDVDRSSDFGLRLMKRFQLADLKRVTTRWQTELEGKGWNSNYISNHDQPRPVSRFGDDGAYRVESAKMLATFNHLLQGTPYIYQGEEIGMTNVAFASIDDYRDIESRNNYRSLVEEHGVSPADALRFLHARSRDNARTPMQWDSGPQAGFTAGKPWIGVNPNYPEISVAQDRSRPDSIFAYYQALIRLRRSNPVVVYGRYGLLLPEHHQIHAFTRTLGDDRLLVALNFSGEPAAARLPEPIASASRGLLLGNYTDAPPGGASPELSLRAFEAQVWRVEQQAAP